MKPRALLILLLGLGIGGATHVVYFHLRQPFDPDSLSGQLAWMKAELHLSDDQFARIKELHEASGPRLRALGAEVAQMQAEFLAFENTRRTTDRVDFVEFAHFVEDRRAIDRECRNSTRALVLAAGSEMTAQQRVRYFGIVAIAQPQIGPLTN